MSFDVGQELAPQIFSINRAKLVAYANASGDQNPIHQNEDFAKSVGLENVIAHGMFTMALAGRYVSDVAKGSEKVREFSARFTKPVVVPADTEVELVISAKVSSVEAGLVKIDITALCNEVKVLGMAKATFSV
ncbi:MAG: MaoC/PaaZ C-terminal domain-containing protein [Actinomycetes bacterium]